MEHRRRRYFTSAQAKQERTDRLARIAQASPPPAAPVDEPDDEEQDDSLPPALEGATDDDEDLDSAIEAAAPRRPPGRPSVKPAHRQAAPSGNTRGDSWWTRTSRENHSTIAAAEQARMASTKEGQRTHRQLGSEVE